MMKAPLKMLWLAVIGGMVTGAFAGDLPQQVEPVAEEQRIEIIIQDSEFLFQHPGTLQFGLPTVLILRNHDIVRHGFRSSILPRLAVQGEGEGIAAYGKGIEGFYVDAGKTLVIRFTADQKGRYEFWCDLHPQMRREIFQLEMSTA